MAKSDIDAPQADNTGTATAPQQARRTLSAEKQRDRDRLQLRRSQAAAENERLTAKIKANETKITELDHKIGKLDGTAS
jgi:hypothetical protein